MALRAKVQRTSGQADALTSRFISSLDREPFIERFRQFWDPFPTMRPPKYLNLEWAVRLSAVRYVSSGVYDDGRRKRILDVGCGAGYYLGICRMEGHEVVGIDLDDEPLYNEMVDFLGIPRVVHRVTAEAPLPELQGTFDVITAHEVVFSFGRPPNPAPWDGAKWVSLLEVWALKLASGGRIVIEFNMDPDTGNRYPPDLPRLLADSGALEATFVGRNLVASRKGT